MSAVFNKVIQNIGELSPDERALVAHQWYQNKTDGLGQDYLSELESSFQTIREFPNTWPRFQKGFRRFLLSKFPFSVIYQSNSKHSIYSSGNA